MAVIVISLICISVPTVASSKEVELYLNGRFVSLRENSIYIEEGNTMVPLRFVTELLGGRVQYDKFTKKISIKKDEKSIELEIDLPKALVNNKEIELPLKPTLKENITMVPLRFVSEALEVYIKYNAINKNIYLSTSTYNASDNMVEGYMLAIEAVYNRSMGLNEDIIYIAMDTNRMRYLSEDSKQTLLKEMERYGVVIEATYDELEERGLIKEGMFTKGVLITIDDFGSEGNRLVLNIDKWRANLGGVGCLGMVLEEDENDWKITEKGMWYMS